MTLHRSHSPARSLPDSPSRSLPDTSSAIGLKAEEHIARISLLQWEGLGPWALGWVLQHFPSALDFWQDGKAAQGALSRWCHDRQPLRGKPKDLTAVLRQIEAIHPKRWAVAPKLNRWLENNNPLGGTRMPSLICRGQSRTFACARSSNRWGTGMQ